MEEEDCRGVAKREITGILNGGVGVGGWIPLNYPFTLTLLSRPSHLLNTQFSAVPPKVVSSCQRVLAYTARVESSKDTDTIFELSLHVRSSNSTTSSNGAFRRIQSDWSILSYKGMSGVPKE